LATLTTGRFFGGRHGVPDVLLMTRCFLRRGRRAALEKQPDGMTTGVSL